jgi:hypothetical protein
MPEAFRRCADCGCSITASQLGRPRLRCGGCRAVRAAEHRRLWNAQHSDYMGRWRAAHPGYAVEYYWSHEGQQRAELREKHRAEHPDWATELRLGKNARRRARRAADSALRMTDD